MERLHGEAIMCIIIGACDTPLVERGELLFREELPLRNVSQVNVVKNIQGHKTYGGVFYAIKDLTE